ncbi:rhomboid family intramembrane serine protease [uncultured Tyzzerella sp.]|uniref:rhomboid family intramembrane serine protease n=1 Tax=uncultured Tyzzerella sp. TaxID=2321398 RepID=UPI002942DA83|nr:rhomboid family intramembrane serine protease [uncultured Tyzzerella sp.]
MEHLKKLKYNSPVILTFTLICLIVLFLGNITGGYTTSKLFCVYRSSFTDPLSYIRVFTHILGHSSFEHFFNNFLIILIVGPMLEEKYGSKMLLALIIITAFITGIVQVIISKDALLGASGIAFMLVILTSFTNVQDGKIPITMILITIMYLGKEVYYGIMYKDNVSRITHIIGGICGIIIGIIISKYYKRRTYYDKT